MKRLSMIAAVAAAAVWSASAMADDVREERAWAWSPLGIGIAAPLQLPFMSSDIWGLRLGGAFAYNADMFGIDGGVVEVSSGSVAGIQGAAFTWTLEDVYGIQSAGLANVVKGSFYGIECSPVNVVWGEFWGIQAGAVNFDGFVAGLQVGATVNWNISDSYGAQFSVANADQEAFKGFSCGVVNYATTFTGFQLGVVNVATDATGFQLGLVNGVESMNGVQIGVVNLIAESKLPVMVIANASF